jgi:hypothetical protein
MGAIIYQQAKNAMQSGKARTDCWVLEFQPSEAKRADPLMGWAGSADTQQQVVLRFPDQASAAAYAKKYGIDATVHAPAPKKLKLQAYSDNFR